MIYFATLQVISNACILHIQFEILVGKSYFPMHVGLADYIFKFEYNISDMNTSYSGEGPIMEFSENFTLPSKPQAW